MAAYPSARWRSVDQLPALPSGPFRSAALGLVPVDLPAEQGLYPDNRSFVASISRPLVGYHRRALPDLSGSLRLPSSPRAGSRKSSGSNRTRNLGEYWV